MEESRTKYILLKDRVGDNVERNILSFGLSTKTSPIQVLRGELLEAVPELEQPQNSHQIALVGLDRKKLRLVCPTEDLTRLSDEEANMLLAISSLGERYDIFIDRKRLDIGRRIKPGSSVFVKVKGISKDLVGVVWYRGELPPNLGTMFGVELIKNPGQGTTDGMFRNKQYFTCGKDSGVFVALDKIKLKDSDNKSPKSPKKEENALLNVGTRIKETVMQPFSKGKNERKLSQGAMETILHMDQRVVTYIGDKPVRGIVRYIGEEKDHSGHPFTIVGLELDSRLGSGSGKLNGKQLFVCRRDFAIIVHIETVIPEKDFDSNPQRSQRPIRQEAVQQCKNEAVGKSLSYNVNTPGTGGRWGSSLRRSNSFDSSAEVMVAAGESSKTNPDAFIEKQRRILMECNSAKNQGHEEGDVNMRDQEREDSGTQMEFEEDHYEDMAPNDLDPVRDTSKKRPITEQPGRSNFYLENQLEGKEYDDYVNIENKDNEVLVDPHKRGKHGEHHVLARGMSQNSPGPQLSRCGDELTSTMEMERTKSAALAGEVVVDCDANSDPKVDRHVPREPDEHMDTQSASLHAEVAGVDNTGTSSNQALVDNPQGLEVGSMVEVPMADTVPRYGVIRWIGFLPQVKDKPVAGLELEDEQTACSDGTFNGERYFACPSGRGFFTLLQHCRQDSRFSADSPTKDTSFHSEKAFGSMTSPVVQGVIAPPIALEGMYCGTMHGLQGHHNSCYLDATLYSMFAFSSVFDALLYRQKRPNDLDDYDKVQVVLREHIVNPLRKNGFVRADRLLNLRILLDKLGSTSGLMSEEKDPEEFLNSLLQQVLKADPFLHLKPRDAQAVNNEGAFFYQIITEKDETKKMVEVHQLLEQSFLSADLILSEVPSCLILQMPRFGSRYKMYDMILPNLELDITHIVENVPRECDMCGSGIAQFECKICYEKRVVGDRTGLSSFCAKCNTIVHSHPQRLGHDPRPIVVPRVYSQHLDEKRSLDKQKMELFAVVCIETSHYVAFVKCGVGRDAPWCFFDSMADRKGERNGYNIPAVVRCPEALEWLSKEPNEILAARERGEIPEKARRLLGDGYLCMYQNLDMAMYK